MLLCKLHTARRFVSIFGLLMLPWCVFTHPVQVPYANDFASRDASDFFAPSGNGYNYGWDWRFAHYICWVTAGNRAASSTVQVKELAGGVPFTMRATFDPEVVISSNTLGFGMLGEDDDFSGDGNSGYYLADVNPNANTFRIVRVNAGNTFIGPSRTIQNLDIRDLNPFELEVRVSYPGGEVRIDFTVCKDGQSDTLTGIDSNNISGSWFGFRNRTAASSADFEVIMDDFELRPTFLVSLSNTPPRIAQIGEMYTYTPDVGGVTVSVNELPSWLALNGNTLEGTPMSADAGSYRVELELDAGMAQSNLVYEVTVPAVTHAVISEFMADNENVLFDEDGDSSDWIEIFNPDGSPLDLGGWYLSDAALQLTRWMFPSNTVIPARGFLTVFASGKTNYPHHADFRVNDAAGESLFLVRPDLSVADAVVNYPRQEPDASYGRVGDYVTSGYFTEPTPGAANATNAYQGFVADTSFSIDRGFFDASQQVLISCATSNVVIRYTTDGSTPTLANGMTATGAVTIAQTTVLRAQAFADGLVPSDTDTQSYLFVDDLLVQQPTGSAPPGWPSGSVNGQVYQYGMDPDVYAQHSLPAMRAALTNIPTFSLVTDLQHLTDPDIGIYSNAENRGRDWERPVSVEVLEAGSAPVQVDGGIRIRGGFSRQDSNPKHPFHLYFRNSYGDSELRYPLFDTEGTDRFKRLDLRATQGRSWHWSHSSSATFNRDVFGREIQRDMGQPYSRSRHVHVLINGIYWGLFQTQERVDRHFAESYFGGNDADYDVMKTRTRSHRVEALDGTPDAWTALYDAAVAGFANDADYLAVQSLVDIDNLIDYMLAIFFTGSTDGPVSLGANVPKNFFALRPRDGRFGFRFFVHDNEGTLQSVNQNSTVNNNTGERLTHFNPKWLHQRLMQNARYVRRFGDRAHRHYFNDGALTTVRNVARFQATADRIDLPIIGESLRWGDARVSSPYTRSNWLSAVNNITANYLPQRHGIVLTQLRGQGMYPDVDAPVFSQHGGNSADGFILTISAPEGTTYYTTDGQSDPADPGALMYSVPLVLSAPSTVVRARTMDNGEWSALTEARFVVAQPAAAPLLAITEIHYNPAGSDETEFVELTNVSTQRLDLSGCQLVDGVSFTFGTQLLEPGARLVVVENRVAFTNAYGTNVVIAGQWSGGLANDTDTVTLNDRLGGLIDQVTYDQSFPWPEPADGEGYSLVRIAAGEWRSSAGLHGNPGSSDALDFAAWSTNHPGGELETYLFGTLPALHIERPGMVAYQRRIAADDYRYVQEVSSNATTWVTAASAGSVEISRVNFGNGLQRRELTLPLDGPRWWFRLRAIPRE